ncbi:metallophosphoesterase [Parasphingorhabdus sp.]|uniref:metallophosphoesterase n=1 Tax=Parasphingorhabdus sp. TaxID=2709688 RepID=UPI00326486CD
MPKRKYLSLITALGLLLTGCMTPSAASQASQPDTQNLPPIIAMGDMHGDYDAYERLMRAAGLLDVNGDWSGGKTIFVQTGDIPDRGPDTRKIIESLQHIEQQAARAGGTVIPMVGNHEAMNIYRDLRYVHPGEYRAFVMDSSGDLRRNYYSANRVKIEAGFREEEPGLTSDQIQSRWEKDTPLGKLEHRAAWSPSGYIGKWIAGNRVVAKVRGYLFAHGGYSQEFSRFSLDDMNKAAGSALQTQDRSRETILRHRLGPLWYRGNVRGRKDDPGFNPDQEIDQVLQTYQATHIIVGHTRSEKGIRVSRRGRLLQVDTGASAHYGGVPSFLRIENGEFFAHTLKGFKKLKIANDHVNQE